MTQTCPISFNRVDANLVRIVAVEVFTVALLLLFTHELVFALILLFDFSVRLLNYKQFSLFCIIAKSIITNFELKAKLCDEAPKRFALYLGLGVIALFTVLFALGFNTIASVFVVILLICASLEALFDYCIGCKIYFLLQLLSKRV